MNIALTVSSTATPAAAAAIAGNYNDRGSPPPSSSSLVRHNCYSRRKEELQSLCLISSFSLLAYQPRGSLNRFHCSSSSTTIHPRLCRCVSSLRVQYEEELEEEKLDLLSDDQSSMAAEAASYQEGVEAPGPDHDGDDDIGRSNKNNDQPRRLQFSGDSSILSACFVGIFTGITVVLFNYAVKSEPFASLQTLYCPVLDFGIYPRAGG